MVNYTFIQGLVSGEHLTVQMACPFLRDPMTKTGLLQLLLVVPVTQQFTVISTCVSYASYSLSYLHFTMYLRCYKTYAVLMPSKIHLTYRILDKNYYMD